MSTRAALWGSLPSEHLQAGLTLPLHWLDVKHTRGRSRESQREPYPISQPPTPLTPTPPAGAQRFTGAQEGGGRYQHLAPAPHRCTCPLGEPPPRGHLGAVITSSFGCCLDSVPVPRADSISPSPDT